MLENNHGLILTVASLAAYATAPSMVDYAASKVAALAFHEGLTAELATIYKAPRVRTVVVCQGYTRTKLFEGFNDKALYPETVAEEIVKAVLAGRSKHVVLPEAASVIASGLRAFPLWMQTRVRDGLVTRMANWRGRQVVQPSLAEKVAEETGDGKGKGVEESTVLVGNE